jgi:hypothetical protein
MNEQANRNVIKAMCRGVYFLLLLFLVTARLRVTRSRPNNVWFKKQSQYSLLMALIIKQKSAYATRNYMICLYTLPT